MNRSCVVVALVVGAVSLALESAAAGATGYVYMDSPEVSGTTMAVDLPDLLSLSYLSGAYADVYSNCKPGISCTDAKRLAKADANGDFPYQPAEPDGNDPFAEVMAYYHMNRARAWFASIGAAEMDFAMKAAVNATNVLLGVACNSGYSNGAVLIGTCNAADPENVAKKTVNFAYDADIVIHEYAHGYVDKTSKLVGAVDTLGLNVMADALNEGVADLIAGFVTGDGVQGRHSLSVLGQDRVRDMTAYFACPEDLLGEGHRDGRIFSSATWEAYEASGRDAAAAKAVALGVAALSSASAFSDAASTIVSSARTHGGGGLADLFQIAYDAHGLSACGRLIEVPSGYRAAGRLAALLNPGLGQYQPHMVQYVYTVPQGATAAVADIEGTGGYAAFYLNQGAPVAFADANTAATYRWSTNPQETIQNPAPGKYHMLLVFEGKDAIDWSFTFTVQGPGMPSVASAFPAAARRGENVGDVTVKGTGFQSGAKVVFPHGISVTGTKFIDATTLKANGVEVAANLTAGAKDVHVFNTDGSSAVGKGLFTVEDGLAVDGGIDAGADAGQGGGGIDAGSDAEAGLPAEAPDGSGGGCSCSSVL